MAAMHLINAVDELILLTYDLVVLPLDGSEPRTVVSGIPQFFANITGLSWSPDGSELAYTSSEPGENPRLLVVAADGSAIPRDVTPGDQLSEPPPPTVWGCRRATNAPARVGCSRARQ